MIQKLSAMSQPCLVMLVGVPGSGKSTWVETQLKTLSEQCRAKWVVLSSDNYIEKLCLAVNLPYSTGYRLYCKEAAKQVEKDLIAAIQGGKHVIWDQTNLSPETRQKRLRKIPSGYHKISVFFDTDPETRRIRLQARSQIPPLLKHVPASILAEMDTQLVVPTKSEGFSNCHVITPTGDLKGNK